MGVVKIPGASLMPPRARIVVMMREESRVTGNIAAERCRPDQKSV